jgi:hypothetical protein
MAIQSSGFCNRIHEPMFFISRFTGLFLLAMLAPLTTTAATDDPVKAILERSLQKTLAQYQASGLKPENLAISVQLLGDSHSKAGFRENVQIYPASVVKLFYLVAAHRWLEDGKLNDTPELRRALRDMIVDSSNDATHYIIDLLTETTSGPELNDEQMAEWSHRRNAINRFFKDLGFENINCNQKTWCEGPYGRERAFLGQAYTNRNMLTTEATARLLVEIARGKAVTKTRSEEMLALMRRDLREGATEPDDQGHAFIGAALAPGAKLWSKAGWTSQTRHDAALVELPNGQWVVLVIFTTGHAQQKGIIPFLAKAILEELSALPVSKQESLPPIAQD